MTFYNDPSPVTLTNEQAMTAKSLIAKSIQNLEFFATRLADNPTRNDLHTHLSLAEHYLTDLCKELSYDSILAQEMEERTKEIRELNLRLDALQKSTSEQVNGEQVLAKLQEYDSRFTELCHALGIHYTHIVRMGPYAITYEITEEIYENQSGYDKDLLKRISKKVPSLLSRNCLDLYKDTYHYEILDTDNNRTELVRIFQEYLPDLIPESFHARRNDFGSFSLRCTFTIPINKLDCLPA